jgi:hypothetical protein
MNYDKEFKELILGHNKGFITFNEVVENQILLVIKYKIVLGLSK